MQGYWQMIVKGEYSKINIMPAEFTKCKRALRQRITLEKGLIEKDKKANETEQNKIKKNNDHKKQISNHKPMTDQVCWKWINFKCWKGEDCTFEHPVICDSDVNRTYCRRTPCDLYHPQVCSTNLSHKISKWGKNVNLDIYIMMYRNSHENNKRRHDTH